MKLTKKIFGIFGISDEDWFYSKWAILFWLRCRGKDQERLVVDKSFGCQFIDYSHF